MNLSPLTPGSVELDVQGDGELLGVAGEADVLLEIGGSEVGGEPLAEGEDGSDGGLTLVVGQGLDAGEAKGSGEGTSLGREADAFSKELAGVVDAAWGELEGSEAVVGSGLVLREGLVEGHAANDFDASAFELGEVGELFRDDERWPRGAGTGRGAQQEGAGGQLLFHADG